MLYSSVYVYGGIINAVTMGEDLTKLIEQMNNDMLENNFDGSEDDARIFNSKGEEVYSFPDEMYDFLKKDYETIVFKSRNTEGIEHYFLELDGELCQVTEYYEQGCTHAKYEVTPFYVKL
ncbi:hypothetical protein [Priestia megaterium]|uniref:hypothetical protein n=1 Tax=Priestia megaterium TaxID=1404 RepID=UPI000BFDDBB7|nr:hypothetical protein [Priestia megaterium]PGQ88214.1 hypothetical protein COA18_04625 [Priestia megaterium]